MYTLTSVKQLIDRGAQVDLLAYPDSKLMAEALERKLNVFPVAAPGYFHPLEIKKLSSILKSNSYDLVHTQASKDLWVIVPALQLAGQSIPLYLTKQVGSFIVKKDFLHKWIYNRVTRAFAISRIIETNLKETCPLVEEKIALLHNGIDTTHFDPSKADGNLLRKEFGVKEGEILIGMLARFSKGKGHEEMIEAAGNLNKKSPHLKYLIVGEASKGEDAYAENIKQMAAAKNLDNMIFTGFRKDVRPVLAALDIFIFPSHNEAFGIALAEALAMGIPSVCSNCDGVLDIAVDRETSLLFQVKDAEDLEIKITELIEKPEMRMSFSIAARKRAVKYFDLQYITQQVILFYEKDTGKKLGA